MSRLGKLLQQTRRKKKFTVDKVCDLTKMKKSYVYALESTDVKAFPAEVYYKSFLKTYASILELDEKEVLEMYEQEKKEDMQGDLFTFAQEQEKQQENVENEVKLKKQEQEQERKQKPKPKQVKKEKISLDDTKKYLVIILSVVFVLLVIFAFIFFKQNKNTATVEEAQPVATVQEQNNTKQTLVIETTMETWVKIIADYQKTFEDIIPADTRKEFSAEDNFVIKIGNVDGAKVYFNGQLVDITTNITPNRTKTLTLRKENNLEK